MNILFMKLERSWRAKESLTHVFLDVIHDFCLELCSRSQDAVYSISKERRAEDLRLLFSNVNKQSREIICPPLFGKVVLIFTRRLGGLLFMVASRNDNDHTLAIYRILYHSEKFALKEICFWEKVKIPWKSSSFVFFLKGYIRKLFLLADPLPLVKFDRNRFSQSTSFKFIVPKKRYFTIWKKNSDLLRYLFCNLCFSQKYF